MKSQKFSVDLSNKSRTSMQIFYFLSASSSILFFLVLLRQIFSAEALDPKNGSVVPAFIVFGDSIVDPGNNNNNLAVAKCNFPPYGRDFIQHQPTGRFSNGKIPSDLIASALGIKELLPAYLDPKLSPNDLLTGVNFASGGAGYDTLTSRIASAISLDNQLELFKEYIVKLETIAGEDTTSTIISDSLYLTFVGANDILNTYYIARRIQYDWPSYIRFLVQSASRFYRELYNLGARKIAVVGIPPVGCVPAQRTIFGGASRNCHSACNLAAIKLNLELSKGTKALTAELPGSRIAHVDIYDVVLNLIQHPSDYGFTETSKGCCGTGTLEAAALCNELTPDTCSDASKYVFWDSFHPTETAYKIIVEKIVQEDIPRII